MSEAQHTDLLKVFLSGALTLESILIPVIGFLMERYIREKERQYRIASTYHFLVWLMIITLVLNSIEAGMLSIYLSGYIQFACASQILFFTIIFYLSLLIAIPSSMIYIWIKEIKR